VAFPVVRVCAAVGGLVQGSFSGFPGQWLLLLFYARVVTCGCSFTVLSVWGSLISFWSVLVFPPALPSLLFLLPYYYLIVITVNIIFTELLALCDRCLGWGWVWLAGLVAGCG